MPPERGLGSQRQYNVPVSFRLIFEIEPPRSADLSKVNRQLDIFGPLVDAILVPDNHLGLPAMSSVAIGVEIAKRGYRPIVALNARDRNELRFRSDALTLRAYGIEEVLFLYGDPVADGRSNLSVRKMLESEEATGFKKGVLAQIGRPLAWRAPADFLLTKLDFHHAAAESWRRSAGFSQPLYCGVLALPDRQMAKKVADNIGDLHFPPNYLAGFDRDPDFGFQAAIEELDDLYTSGVDGAQVVVPANRRRFAEMLEKWMAHRGIG